MLGKKSQKESFEIFLMKRENNSNVVTEFPFLILIWRKKNGRKNGFLHVYCFWSFSETLATKGM